MNMEEIEDEIEYHRNLNHEDDENTDIDEDILFVCRHFRLLPFQRDCLLGVGDIDF